MWLDSKPLATKAIEFDIELIPEHAKPPVVTYHPVFKKLEFKKSERVHIGTFSFESQAEHYFAHSFADKFYLRSYKDNLPLTDILTFQKDNGRNDKCSQPRILNTNLQESLTTSKRSCWLKPW